METVIRVAIVYLFVMVALRLMGKREFSQLSPMELVSLLLVPELVQQGLVGEDFSLVNGLIGVSTLFLLVFLTSMLSHRSKTFARAIESTPTVLVNHGQLVPRNLDLERISAEDVFTEMLRSGLDRLEQVRWAVLETDGKISVVPEPPNATSTRRDGDT